MKRSCEQTQYVNAGPSRTLTIYGAEAEPADHLPETLCGKRGWCQQRETLDLACVGSCCAPQTPSKACMFRWSMSPVVQACVL